MKRFLPFFIAIILSQSAFSQTSQEFWFAPPEVTSGHVIDNPVMLRIATGSVGATVTIEQPANTALFNGGSPIVVVVPPNSATTVDLSADLNNLETKPSDTVLNTGLHISSTATITCYYEVNTGFNPDIFALKGNNGLGMEFYTPFQNVWANGAYTPTPYTSFDIVATEDNTVVFIYPRVPLDGGHPALSSYSFTLNEGQTYSGSVTGGVGADNPAGTAIVSDKPIAVSVKDDSVWPQPAGCKDLIGDQIVPTNIVGTEYIINKGGLTVPERAYLTATQNGCDVYVAGVYQTTLFSGETFGFDITAALTYITTSKPAYCFHVSGFGCEVGGAILPPLNCAGSDRVNFVRSTTEYFGLNILVPAGAEGDFDLNGSPTLISASDFSVVPGTGGAWMGAQISFNTTDIPVGLNNLITNPTEVFAVGLINGGATSGCRFGYFSEFASEIFVDAGGPQTMCANDSIDLSGSVSGGTTTGQWSTSGSGVFLPDDITLNAIYVPSFTDIASGSVVLTLTSTGACFPITDNATINISPAPTVDAGTDISACQNNPNVTLNGAVTIATGGVWSGGNGTYLPNNTTLNATYSPTAAEISSGNLILTLTTIGNGICNPETDDVLITFSSSPTVDAGVNQTVCANNPDVNLSGGITVATGGIWSGGTGTFSPNNTNLNAIYTPSAAEISAGTAILTLTTTGNGSCLAVADNMSITITPAPTANAGIDQSACENNAVISLNGTVDIATGGQWSGGLGIFSPSSTTLNASYTPTALEIASGGITLTLTTTGNGGCLSHADDIFISFTAKPTASAGADQVTCSNAPEAALNGSIIGATGGLWSGGTGSFVPNNSTLNTLYTPSPAEIAAGSVTLTLTTTGNGNCLPESDNMTIIINPGPQVDAGLNSSVCGNNADVTLNGSVNFATGGTWTGGLGTFNPSASILNATYTPTAAEITSGSVVLTLTSTGNGICNAENDNVTISFTTSPTTNAGVDQTLCANNANANLSGSITMATGGLWTGGLGSFNPSNTSLNAIYSPTQTEIASGSVTLTLTTTGNGTCNAESDNVNLNFTAGPTVNAGLDQEVCANNPDVVLVGSVTIATGGFWSGGLGSFAPNNTDLNATYTPSAAEITSGTVTLTLNTTGNGTCLTETDELTITINAPPSANAGADAISCANNPNVSLGGIVTNATGGIWTGGTGSFIPTNTALNATYIPSPSEISTGSLTLTLTTTGTGDCSAVSDDMSITITNAPSADAGPDEIRCANNSDVILSGSVMNAAGGQWTGGLGLFNPSANALNTTYTPTEGEIASGSVTLTLTTTGIGTCNPETDEILISFTPRPTVDAGSDLNSCENNPTVTLSGIITIASGGIWSGGDGVFTPSNSDLNATYTPSSSEITAGEVKLRLTTTGNGTCNSEFDEVMIYIDQNPSVNAGSDLTTCVDNLSVNLSGSVSGITNTGAWSTSGSGFFVPNNTTLNATYVASAADSLSGSISLTLESTNSNTCLPIYDGLVVTILPSGTASAGSDQTVCANNATVSLSGTVGGGATAGIWSTTGNGVFSPNDSTLNAIYIPGSLDIIMGTVDLTLTANSCNPVYDELNITITPAPFVNAGSDQTVCADDLNVSLSGVVSGASSTGIWSTTGTGTFLPSNTNLNATYVASSADSIAQVVKLILSATGIGTCIPVKDTMSVNIFHSGIANAGTDQTVCANNGTVTLNGSISGGATEGIWSSSGSGSFMPSATDMNASYIPSAADTINGSVNIILSATNSCNAASDFMTITYSDAPFVNAGIDLAICGTNPVVDISGTIIGATGGIWTSSGSGIFSPNVTSLDVTYIASESDINSGSINIYLTSIGNGSCNAVVDSMQINITSGISVNAGADQTVCSSAAYTVLQGQVTNGSSTGFWTTLGTGTFSPSDSVLTAEYYFSAADTTIGFVDLILKSINNGSCAAETDTVRIEFGSSVNVDAGADQIICTDHMSVNLNGFVSGGSSTGIWSSSGTGLFSPNDTVLTATYLPSPTDSIVGFVEIILSSTNNGGCAMGSDTMMVILESIREVDAGSDQFICLETDSVFLSGDISNTNFGKWNTSGSGAFYPSDTSLNIIYIPSNLDLAIGSWDIILNATDNQACVSLPDTLTVEVIKPIETGFEAGDVCIGSAVYFNDTSIVSFGTVASFEWKFGDGTTSVNQNPVHEYGTPGIYEVTLETLSSLGCRDSITQSVIVHTQPIAGFSVDSNLQVDRNIQFLDESIGAVLWYWMFGDGIGTSNVQNPIYNYSNEGNYVVQQIVESAFGCTDTTFVTITIENLGVFPPVLPSGFSPNDDGENDLLVVRGGPFLSVELKVYNGWGNLVFESNQVDHGWNGEWKGKPQPTGDYIYTMKAVTIDGKEYVRTGSVSIIK